MSLNHFLFCSILLCKVIKDWRTGNGIKRNRLEVGMDIHSASSSKV